MENYTNDADYFSFTHISHEPIWLKKKEYEEQLLQLNLDQTITMQRFRYSGYINIDLIDDYESLLHSFFRSPSCLHSIGIHSGSYLNKNALKIDPLDITVTNTGVFDKLQDADIVTLAGNIRGCLEELFDGVPAGDLLREMLLNEDSENAHVLKDIEKELIFHLFKTLVIGGSMCQPDVSIEKYLDLTKAFYKELVTAFREEDKICISGKAFRVKAIEGMMIFDSESKLNTLLVVIDPLQKIVTVFKNTYKPFW